MWGTHGHRKEKDHGRQCCAVQAVPTGFSEPQDWAGSAVTSPFNPEGLPFPEALPQAGKQVETSTQTLPLTDVTVRPHFQVRNLANCQSEWGNIADNPRILDYVKGVKFPLMSEPQKQCVPFPYKFTQTEIYVINNEVLKFCHKGIIEPALHVAGEFISNIFLRLKPNGQVRLILDLTLFNKYVQYKHIKMFSLETARDRVTHDSWLASVDLKDAYYTIPIYQHDRKFLGFFWDNTLYEFTCMPNGLACCPRIFTQIVKPDFSHMARNGHIMFPYILSSWHKYLPFARQW